MMHLKTENEKKNKDVKHDSARFSEIIQFPLFGMQPFETTRAVSVPLQQRSIWLSWWKWDGFCLKCVDYPHAHTISHSIPISLVSSQLFFAVHFCFYSFWIYVKRKWRRFFTMNSLRFFFCKSRLFRIWIIRKRVYDLYTTQMKDCTSKNWMKPGDLNKFDQVSLHLCRSGRKK